MPNLSNTEKNAITRFKNNAREFWAMWETLNDKKYSEALTNIGLKKEYDAVMKKGATIRANVETVTNAIDKAARMYDGVKDWLSNTFGAIPLLIPVATIAISVAAMTKWTSDAYQLNKKITKTQELIAQGISPGMAAQIVKDSSGGLGINIKGVALPLLVLGGMFIFYKTRRP